MGLPDKVSPLNKGLDVRDFLASLENASQPVFYGWKEMNSGNNHVNVEEDPVSMTSQP